MRVRRRGARRFVFVVGEQFLHRPRRASPLLAAGSDSKTFGMRAPAHVTGEHGFFIVGGVAVFRFECLQEPDGGDIVAGLFLQAALADPVGVGYPEVAGGFFLGLDVEDDSSGRRNSLHRQFPGLVVFHLPAPISGRTAGRANCSAVSSSACCSRFSCCSCASIEGW